MDTNEPNPVTFVPVQETLKLIEEIKNDSQDHLQLKRMMLQKSLEKSVGGFAFRYLSDKNAAINALSHASALHRFAALTAISGIWRPDATSIHMILSIMENEVDERLRCFAITIVGSYYHGAQHPTIEHRLKQIIESMESSPREKESASDALGLVSGRCSLFSRAKELGLKISDESEQFLNKVGQRRIVSEVGHAPHGDWVQTETRDSQNEPGNA